MPDTQNTYDSGSSFSTVSIPNCSGIRAYAHAFSNSSGGPNNDHRQAYIYEVQAWGNSNPYTDIGLSVYKGGVQRIGTKIFTGSNIAGTNNLRIAKGGSVYGIPFLSNQTLTLQPSFNGYGYQWGNVASLAADTASTIQLFTSNNILMATDNGFGGWNSAPGFTVTGSISNYSSGSNGGYSNGLVLVNISPAQGTAPYIVYRDPQASNVKIRSNGSSFYLPNASANLNVNLTQLSGTGHSYSGGGGSGSITVDNDFVNNAYGTNSPNTIDVFSTHIFPQAYTVTNINFRVSMLYYAYGDSFAQGNFSAAVYYTQNFGGSWTTWWSTSG